MSWHTKAALARTVPGIMHGSRAFGPPYQAALFLSNRCNVNCVHCYFHSPLLESPNTFHRRFDRMEGQGGSPALSQSFRPHDADTDWLWRTTEELIEMGTGSFLFTAMGEP
ncbi:MAG: hypothetical protein R6V05_11000, partial [Candidatus Brocadiia bacterium]